MQENKLIYSKRKVEYIIKKTAKKYIIIFFIAIIVIMLLTAETGNYIISKTKTTEIGFENIGELVTQSVYCTEVNVIQSARELWGIEIPFTQSKYIYSYDVIIKAGFDFQDIKWNIKDNIITVTLPKVKILSNQIVDGSFEVYHEYESIFTKISLSENNKAQEKLKQNAQNNAIKNGLYDNAKINAETILTSFFSAEYDMNKYEIKFIYK